MTSSPARKAYKAKRKVIRETQRRENAKAIHKVASASESE